MLKGTSYGINQQFPSVIEERRKELYPIMRSFREEGNRVKLVRDRLYVNGQLYNPDETESEAYELANSSDRDRYALGDSFDSQRTGSVPVTTTTHEQASPMHT